MSRHISGIIDDVIGPIQEEAGLLDRKRSQQLAAWMRRELPRAIEIGNGAKWTQTIRELDRR